MQTAYNLLYSLATALGLILIGKLLATRIAAVYPALLTIVALDSLTYFLTRMFPGLYFYVYWAVGPAAWLTGIWLTLEIYNHWTRRYPGIGTFGRGLLIFLFLTCCLLSLAIGRIDFAAADWAGPMAAIYKLRRGAALASFLFLAASLMFFRHFGAAVSRNLVRHHYAALAYFFVIAGNAAFTNNFWRESLTALAVQQASLAACYLLWIFALSADGETVLPVAGPSPAEIDRIEARSASLIAAARQNQLPLQLRRWRS